MVLLKNRVLGNITNTCVKHFKGEVSNAAPGANRTFNTITKAPCRRFTHVRVKLANKYSDGTSGLDFYGWAQIAHESMKAKGLPVNLINYGYQGSSTAQSLIIAKRAIDFHKPSILLFPGSSVFNLIDESWFRTFTQRALDACQYAQDNGVLPIVTFHTPVNGILEANDYWRREIIRRFKESGILVCDMTPATATNTMPQTWIPGKTNDNVHPNIFGYRDMPPIYEETITQLLIENGITW